MDASCMEAIMQAIKKWLHGCGLFLGCSCFVVCLCVCVELLFFLWQQMLYGLSLMCFLIYESYGACMHQPYGIFWGWMQSNRVMEAAQALQPILKGRNVPRVIYIYFLVLGIPISGSMLMIMSPWNIESRFDSRNGPSYIHDGALRFSASTNRFQCWDSVALLPIPATKHRCGSGDSKEFGCSR